MTSIFTSAILSTVALSLAAACSDDGAPAKTPSAPTLGPLTDRVGRPGVAELLVAPFAPAEEHQSAVADALGSADPATWQAASRGPIAASLALWDAVDGVCGNQALAGATAAAGRYDALATLLADDRLWVDTRAGSCGHYLAVELGVADDCGGRTPAMDVVDVSLSLLATGATTGLSDGVAADADGGTAATFPFLRPPAH
ncbi:MAG: hypothetical protein U1F43_07350 [Myxococcota bacterium]